MASIYANWARTQSCRPSTVCEPKTLLDLRAILASARRDKRKLRVIGTLNSVNDIAMSDDILVDLKHFNKVLAVDSRRHMVKIQTGITLTQLNEVLDLHGLALPNLGSISWQTFAGLISTGAHATGAKYGIFAADMVVELQIMLPSGELVTCSRKEYEGTRRCAFVLEWRL